MMYNVARFNPGVSACEFNSGEDMKASKEEAFLYFISECEKIVRENLDD